MPPLPPQVWAPEPGLLACRVGQECLGPCGSGRRLPRAPLLELKAWTGLQGTPGSYPAPWLGKGTWGSWLLLPEPGEARALHSR